MIPLKVVRGNEPEGGCGKCTACCICFEIKELDKKAMEPCKYLDQENKKCGIYGMHPLQCKVFKCHWLYGLIGGGKEKYRPDKLGLVFTLLREGHLGGILRVYKIDKGIKLGAVAKKLLRRLEKEQIYLFEHKLYGPRRLLQEWLDKNQFEGKVV